MSRRGFPVTRPIRARRKNEAEERAAVRASRTPQQQLAILDARPGNSAKERGRLNALIEKPVTKKPRKTKRAAT